MNKERIKGLMIELIDGGKIHLTWECIFNLRDSTSRKHRFTIGIFSKKASPSNNYTFFIRDNHPLIVVMNYYESLNDPEQYARLLGCLNFAELRTLYDKIQEVL